MNSILGQQGLIQLLAQLKALKEMEMQSQSLTDDNRKARLERQMWEYFNNQPYHMGVRGDKIQPDELRPAVPSYMPIGRRG